MFCWGNEYQHRYRAVNQCGVSHLLAQRHTNERCTGAYSGEVCIRGRPLRLIGLKEDTLVTLEALSGMRQLQVTLQAHEK